MLRIVKAIRAFLTALLGQGECPHHAFKLDSQASHCADCGYAVQVNWMFVHCRDCQAKRMPNRTLLGQIKPLHEYCRHCGSNAYRLVQKQQIEAYELMYAVGVKQTLYTEPRQPHGNLRPFRPRQAFAENTVVIDAEVISTREFKGPRKAFSTPPFEWQRQQNPQRYGAKQGTTLALCKLPN